MEKTVADKALEGGLLSKLVDPHYFYVFSAFALFWDLALSAFHQTNLLSLTFHTNQAFPLGSIFLLISSFSFLAIFVVPVVFHFLNDLFWAVVIGARIPLFPGESKATFASQMENGVRWRPLMVWAIKNGNSQAMELAKTDQRKEADLRKNKSNPCLLAICIVMNYFAADTTVLKALEAAVAPGHHVLFLLGLWTVVVVLIYVSLVFFALAEPSTILPGLKKHIDPPTEPRPPSKPKYAAHPGTPKE